MGFPCRRVQTQAGGVEIWADGNHRLDKKAINEEEAERIFMLMFVNLNASFWPVVPKGNTYPPVCGVEICNGVKSSWRLDLGVGRLFFKLVPTLLRLCEWWQRCSEWGSRVLLFEGLFIMNSLFQEYLRLLEAMITQYVIKSSEVLKRLWA